MRRNLARILSIILAFALCLSIAPFTAFAEGGSGGEAGDGGSGSSVSLGSGDSYYEGNCSGVRIYLATGQIVQQNLSSDGKTLTFGKRSNAAILDTYKRYAIYEISEGSSSTSNYGYGIINGTETMYTYLPTSGTMRKAYVLKRSGSFNRKPTFKELVGSGHGNFTHWSPWEDTDFSSLSGWANGVFKDDSTTKVSIDTFLTNYRNLLKETFKVTNAELSSLPKNRSEFVSGNYCIVVEPVMVTAIESGSTDIYVAWSAQDFDGGEKDPKYYYSDSGEYRYKDETLDNANGLCKSMKPSYTRSNFSGRAIQMKKGFYINYTSKKYNQSSSPKGLVTAAPNGVYPNSAGGFAFYYSNDVIAQDVPVQVANTVVVDVGAPKYINGSGSATGGDLGDSGTLRVAVNSTAYLDTSGDPIKSDTLASATKKGTAYSWYSGGGSLTKQTYSGGKKAVGDFAFNGTAIQSWLDDDSQTKFIKSGHTLSTVKNKNILLSSAVYSCIVNAGAGSISTSPSSVASDLKTQLGDLGLGYSATQLKTTRETTTGYTVICVTDYSRTAETLEGTAKAA